MAKKAVGKRKQIAARQKFDCKHLNQKSIGIRNKDKSFIMFCEDCKQILSREQK